MATSQMGTDGRGRNFHSVRVSKGWRLFTINRLGECPECGALVGDWKGASIHKEYHNFIDELTTIVIGLIGGEINEEKPHPFNRNELSLYWEAHKIGSKVKINR